MSAMFLGCGPSASVSDEFARIAAQEVSNMSANSSSMIGAQGLGKTLAAAADTVYFDWNVYPYAWDAGVGGYVRTATITGSDGYERVRIDTLIFKDANGGTLRAPTFATCKTISHVRTVTHSKGGSELNIRVVMTSAISLTPDTTHVKNGTIIGTYDGEQVGTGTITSVTRAYTGGHWQFPRSGNIAVDFPRRTYNVDFLGSGNAKLTITNKATDKTTIVNYHVDEK
jgi:hypothetical protein